MSTNNTALPTPFIPYNTNLTQKAKENRNNPSPPEKKIWTEILHNRKMKGFKFLRQKPIDNYIVDFYCSALRLVVEVDGDSHAEQEMYDKERTKRLNERGIKVVRYWNNDVMGNIEGIFEDLERIVENRKEELLKNTLNDLGLNPLNPPYQGDFKTAQ